MTTNNSESTLNTNHSKLTCSIVVCTRDRPQALDACLAAISAGTKSAAEVIVVDSAPKLESAKKVAERWGAKYIYESRPGVSRARNRGACESESDILVYVDGDSIPEQGWLEPLADEFADPHVAVAAGRVLPPDSDMEMLPLYAWLGIVDHGLERRVIDQSCPDWYELVNFNCFLLGANMAVRKKVFREWEGFDERLGAGTRIPGGEESMALFNIVNRGYRVVYAPGSLVRHAFPRSLEQLRLRALRAIEASAAYLVLLFCEQPGHRKETWGYIKGKLKRVTPLYKRGTSKGQTLISSYRVLAARLKGIYLYFYTRLAWKSA